MATCEFCKCRSSSCDGAGAAEKIYPTSMVRGGGQEELPRVQGKEQWLHFAGAAVKRYPTSKVREIQGKTVDAKRGH